MMKINKGKINLIAFILLAVAISLSATTVISYNYDHVNVTSTVNVTNAPPTILDIQIDGEVGNITLNAGGFKTVYCNATIRDYNGFDDINVTNATFYYFLNSSSDSDDNNEHYTNASCVESANDGQYVANYSCSFQVNYFANNGTWYCNVSVNDSLAYKDDGTNTTGVNKLYALNVTDVIDYGNLSVTDTSNNITATVTNFGNTDINVSVLGYGLTQGDGIGLVCSVGTNISIENQRFSSNPADDWAAKTQLAITNQDVGATLTQQTDDVTAVTQNTYWQLYVPPNPFGVCNGTVRFTATVP